MLLRSRGEAVNYRLSHVAKPRKITVISAIIINIIMFTDKLPVRSSDLRQYQTLIAS